jgi:hypothetical protein
MPLSQLLFSLVALGKAGVLFSSLLTLTHCQAWQWTSCLRFSLLVSSYPLRTTLMYTFFTRSQEGAFVSPQTYPHEFLVQSLSAECCPTICQRVPLVYLSYCPSGVDPQRFYRRQRLFFAVVSLHDVCGAQCAAVYTSILRSTAS